MASITSIPAASIVPYDNTVSGLSSENVKAAIDELAGIAVTGSSNFSYEYIATGVTVTIPIYQQMLLMDDIIIDGDLVIEGTLVTGVVA